MCIHSYLCAIFSCLASESQGTMIACSVTWAIAVNRDNLTVSHSFLCQTLLAPSPRDTPITVSVHFCLLQLVFHAFPPLLLTKLLQLRLRVPLLILI